MTETIRNNEKAKIQEMVDFYIKEIDGKNDSISYTKAQLKELKEDLAECKERLNVWKTLLADLNGTSAKEDIPDAPAMEIEAPATPEEAMEMKPEEVKPQPTAEPDKVVDTLFPENNAPAAPEEEEKETPEQEEAKSDMNEIWPDGESQAETPETIDPENDGFPDLAEAWPDNN